MIQEFKMAWHRFLARHYELMMEDCLCPREKMRLAAKARYHFGKRVSTMDSTL